MRTTALVALASLTVLAGCLGAPGASSPDATNNADSVTDGTERVTPFPDTTVEWPAGPIGRPERPDEMTRESVREFVRAHEYGYAYNSLWLTHRTNVSVDCSVDSVTANRSGYSALVSCYGYSATNDPETNETLHADWFKQTYRYDVDETTIRRILVGRYG